LRKACQTGRQDPADALPIKRMRKNSRKYLYLLYAERVASMRLLPFDSVWGGATNFENK
jgi:adenylate cyclase